MWWSFWVGMNCNHLFPKMNKSQQSQHGSDFYTSWWSCSIGMSWANIVMLDLIATVFDNYQVKPAIAGATDAAGMPNYLSFTTMVNNHNKDDLKDSGETLGSQQLLLPPKPLIFPFLHDLEHCSIFSWSKGFANAKPFGKKLHFIHIEEVNTGYLSI